MAEDRTPRSRTLAGLRDVSGTTVALTSLAILGAAAVVTAPLWLWYRRKRKRADALLREAREAGEVSESGSPATADSAPEPMDENGGEPSR